MLKFIFSVTIFINFTNVYVVASPTQVIHKENNNMYEVANKLLNNNYGLIIEKDNAFEKKANELCLNVQTPKYSIVDANGQALRNGDIPMVGLFCKKVTDLESGDLKYLAEYILKNANQLGENGDIGMSVKLTQNNKTLSGSFMTSAEDNIQEIKFLRKQYTFINSQLANIANYIPIKAIRIRHEVQVVNNNQIKVQLYINNIGQETVNIINPLALHHAPLEAPHMWYAIIFQLFSSENKTPLKPDYAFSFKDINIDEKELNLIKNTPIIEIPAKEERVFSFLLSAQEWEQATKQLKKGIYHSRITMALPFETDKIKRVVVSSEEKKINIFE